jgi:hypothetical protein
MQKMHGYKYGSIYHLSWLTFVFFSSERHNSTYNLSTTHLLRLFSRFIRSCGTSAAKTTSLNKLRTTGPEDAFGVKAIVVNTVFYWVNWHELIWTKTTTNRLQRIRFAGVKRRKQTDRSGTIRSGHSLLM